MIVLTVLAVVAAAWGVMNLCGWAAVGGVTRSLPLNWRILGGPVAYMSWLERTDEAAYKRLLWGN